MVRKVIRFEMTPQVATKTIRRLAEKSENIFVIDHAKKRMKIRHITNDQVFDCLKKGNLIEGPYRDIGTGNWRMKLEYTSAGQDIRVVAELFTREDGEKIIIITVF